jgi:hypothetical protein
MGTLITDNPDKVYSTLYKALERLILNRREDGAFTDEEEVKEVRYYFSTLEGLECLLIPFVSLDKNQFWEPLKNKYPELQNIIIDDINFILSYNLGQEHPPKEHGAPYFVQGKRKVPYWTSECASFTLSVLSNFLEMRRLYGLPQNPKKKAIEEALKLNFDWLQYCKRDRRGWSWTTETPEHPWPTWSLLDTFEELLWYQPTKNLFKGFEKECDEIVGNIVSGFSENPLGHYLSIWQEKVVNNKPYNVEVALDLTRLMLAASLYAKDPDILPLAQIIYSWASDSTLSYFDYKFHLKEKADYIYDSSLLPSLFRTLIIMAEKLKPRRIDTLDENIRQSHRVVLNKIYNNLNESFINNGKHEGLWGIRDTSGIIYELYYTERTIEALTAFLYNYPSEKMGEEISSKKAVSLRKSGEVLKKQPASVSKRSEIPNDISKYTAWIPQLCEYYLPEGLKDYTDWPVEDLAEFYLFRLFNIALLLDGAEWGYKKRGKRLPDGLLVLPDSRNQCLYDVKSSKGPYKLTVDELRKFKEYAKEGKKKALASQKDVQFFLVIANSFDEGNLKDRASEFYRDESLKLVCMAAEDICRFADSVRLRSTNPSDLHIIKWSHLLSKGEPLIKSTDYDKIRETWMEDLD